MESENDKNKQTGNAKGIAAFAAHAGALGNVILGTTADKDAFEPLPFTDYEEFRELEGDVNQLRININPVCSKKKIFVPQTPITVTITADRKYGHHHFNSTPYIYTIKLTHGKYEWKVTRSYKDIKDAHRILAKQVKQDLGQSCSDIPKINIKPDWPIFPTEYDNLVPENLKEERCKHLSEYLNRVLTYPPFRNNPAVIELIGVSPLSFTIGLGKSYKEGLLKKRTGDNIYYGNCSKLKICCDRVKILSTQRWFCIKETYITYMNHLNGHDLCFPLLIDNYFSYKKGIRAGALHSITIKNSQRSLVIKCKNEAQQLEWYESIENLVENEAKEFCTRQLYDSFAPIRKNQTCKWYVNAEHYMEHALAGIQAAKEEIFITDWWLCPEIFLKRPSEDLQYRLDKILIKKSRENVKIYVLLFKEVEMAIGLKSLRAKRVLTEAGKNPNIKVIRHPEHTPAGVFLWSHHEKCLIIDQSVCFMGGIDLCFGRWDDDLHRLTDLGRVENKLELADQSIANAAGPSSNTSKEDEKIKLKQNNIELENINNASQTPANPSSLKAADALFVAAFLGRFVANTKAKQELNKNAIISNEHVEIDSKISEPEIKKSNSNEKNKRDATSSKTNTGTTNNNAAAAAKSELNQSCQLAFTNKSKATKYNMLSVEEHEKEGHLDSRKRVKKGWSKIMTTVKVKKNRLKDKMNHRSETEDSDDDDTEANNEEDLKRDIAEMPVISNEGYYWVGKDYSNCYKQDFQDIDEFSKDQFDRNTIPRMPWRDEALVVCGAAARDVARHFIQRWNQCKREKSSKNTFLPFLLPKNYKDGIDYDFSWFKEKFSKEPTYKCDIQITRSSGSWSCGLNTNEQSILNAYKALIAGSENFIYIENQFFVTTVDTKNDPDVKNGIGKALLNRIVKAYRENKKFRVYVVLPLLPGFDAKNAIMAVQYYNLRSINIGKYSIYSELKRYGIQDPSDYITFHGMRNHAVLMNKLVQEIIYVHSKLMIVDDKYVICGSANINDRSLLGDRDSELAAVITDTEFINSKFNNTPVQVGKYAQSLRHKIFKQHIGIYFNNPNGIDVSDCTCDKFYNLFRDISKRNTDTYDEVFKCIPSDNILTFQDFAEYSSKSGLSTSKPSEAKKQLDETVRGFIVDFPLKFLSKEANFFPNYKTAEGLLVPTQMWT